MRDLTGFTTEPIKEITGETDVAKEAGWRVSRYGSRRNPGANGGTPEEVLEDGLREAPGPEPAPGDGKTRRAARAGCS